MGFTPSENLSTRKLARKNGEYIFFRHFLKGKTIF